MMIRNTIAPITPQANNPIAKTQYGVKNSVKMSVPASFGSTHDIKSPWLIDKIRYMGEKFTSADQRLFMGLTALGTQPFFDLYNKKVDKETRAVSCAKTVSRIIVGTIVGVIIRSGCIKATEKLCQPDAPEMKGFFANSRRWLLPKVNHHIPSDKLGKYQKAVGTLLAVGIMIFTNFAVDAPLTKYFTNILKDKFYKTKGDKQ